MKTLAFFTPSLIISVFVLGAVFWYGGVEALFLAALLSVLEVTLSFDNAVVNAKVLARMTPAWQQRFLTWGILIAVVGTRLILPILIVAVTVWTSPWVIAKLAFFDPEAYGHLLEGARYAINSFGASFLLMVSLKYFMNASKDRHWLHVIEHYLARSGKIESIAVAVVLIALTAVSFLVPDEASTVVLVAGIVGIVIFILMEGITSSFSVSTEEVEKAGLAMFIYLNVLDTAFSLDSVVGAFALSNSIPVIVAGLGIGAYFVRTLTIYLVKKKALDTIIFLEHGAHWAIFGLAASMLVGTLVEVPEIITGGIGLFFVVAAYYSSLLLKKKEV
ncbi:MAG: DUF475 domain-containing protein [Patescibacteria group bacterium]